MKYILFILIFLPVGGNAQSIESTIAQEFLSEGKLSKAISTCENAVKDDPADKDCLVILRKTRQILAKKTQDENARKVAEIKMLTQKAIALESKRSSKECVRAKLVHQYCSKILQVGIQQNLIDREKRVAKDTGTVNLKTLNQAGSDKALLEDQSVSLALTLKSKVEYDISPSECRLQKDDFGFPRTYEHPLTINIDSICGG